MATYYEIATIHGAWDWIHQKTNNTMPDSTTEPWKSDYNAVTVNNKTYYKAFIGKNIATAYKSGSTTIKWPGSTYKAPANTSSQAVSTNMLGYMNSNNLVKELSSPVTDTVYYGNNMTITFYKWTGKDINNVIFTDLKNNNTTVSTLTTTMTAVSVKANINGTTYALSVSSGIVTIPATMKAAIASALYSKSTWTTSSDFYGIITSNSQNSSVQLIKSAAKAPPSYTINIKIPSYTSNSCTAYIELPDDLKTILKDLKIKCSTICTVTTTSATYPANLQSMVANAGGTAYELSISSFVLNGYTYSYTASTNQIHGAFVFNRQSR